MFNFDSTLRRHAKLTRFTSLNAAGININDMLIPRGFDALVEKYRAMITKTMILKFKKPQLSVSDMGQLVNIDAALEGISECYLHTRSIKPTLRLGINLSAQVNSSNEMYAMRAAATIAVFQVSRSRGQNVQFEIAYGNGLTVPKIYSYPCAHIRVALQNPNVNMIARIMGSNACRDVFLAHNTWFAGNALGVYRFHEFKEQLGWNEYDFVLDRLEYTSLEDEYNKILKQIEHLR